MVPRSGADMLTHRTASPSEPCGAATAVTTGAGLTVAAVACCVEGVCVRTIGNPSDGGAPAVRSAAPATARRVDRIRQYYVGARDSNSITWSRGGPNVVADCGVASFLLGKSRVRSLSSLV